MFVNIFGTETEQCYQTFQNFVAEN